MVSKACRGKGIGSLLVKASLHFAKNLGFQALQFNMVFSQNTSAIQIYKKLAFSIIGTVPRAIQNSDGSYQDGYAMCRNLDDIALIGSLAAFCPPITPFLLRLSL